MVIILINKDVSEPSYKGLNFTVHTSFPDQSKLWLPLANKSQLKFSAWSADPNFDSWGI